MNQTMNDVIQLQRKRWLDASEAFQHVYQPGDMRDYRQNIEGTEWRLLVALIEKRAIEAYEVEKEQRGMRWVYSTDSDEIKGKAEKYDALDLVQGD